MARYRDKPYSLLPRTIGDKVVWYYYSYDADGRRLPARSTGIGFTSERDRQKKKREAEAKCSQLLELGELGRPEGILLEEWIKARHFWNFKRSGYIRGILARSPKDKPGITEGFCLKAEQITRDRIIPAHGKKAIEKITPYDCEQLLFTWQSFGSNKTANNWKSVYSTILGEYERELKMKNTKSTYFNPWKVVAPLTAEKKPYGGLTVEEVKKIIAPPEVKMISGRNKTGEIYYIASKLAFLAGLRIAEVCGLHTDDVRDIEIKKGAEVVRMSYLEVSKQWNIKLKRRTMVKDKDVRRIPIAAEMRDELERFLTGPKRFVFSIHPRQDTPISASKLRLWLYKKMEDAGITEEVRAGRNIAFHSTRRFFNTLLRRAKVDDATIRKFTGHDDVSMTEHYTDYLPEDLQEISRAQSVFLLEK